MAKTLARALGLLMVVPAWQLTRMVSSMSQGISLHTVVVYAGCVCLIRLKTSKFDSSMKHGISVELSTPCASFGHSWRFGPSGDCMSFGSCGWFYACGTFLSCSL